ncbi:MAG: hypothetical protein ACFFCD_07240 [Promethearchaeota archaeon]
MVVNFIREKLSFLRTKALSLFKRIGSKISWKDDRFKIFFLALVIYLFSLSVIRAFHSEDEFSYFYLTYSIVENQSFIIDQTVAGHHLSNTENFVYYNGNWYSKYPPGLPILAIPFYLIGGFLWQSLGFDGFPLIAMCSISAFSAALSLVIIYEFCTLFNFSLVAKRATTITYGFGTIAWVYAKTFFSHSTATLFILVGLYFFISMTKDENTDLVYTKSILSGTAIGLATLIRYTGFLFVFPLAFYFFRKQMSLKKTRLVLFTIPLLMFILLAGWYNFICFDSPFITGYHLNQLYGNETERFTTPIYIGLWGLLISPKRGLFIYSPVLIFSIVGVKHLYTEVKEETILLISSFVLLLLVYSAWWYWPGGLCYGPRLLHEAIPMFTIPIGKSLDSYKHKRIFWIVFILLLCFSIYAQFAAVATDFITTDYPTSFDEIGLIAVSRSLFNGEFDTVLSHLLKI